MLAAVVVLLAGGVAAVWRLGGFESVTLANDTVEPGQVIEVNGMEFTFIQASVFRGSLGTGVRIDIQATCRNTGDAGAVYLPWFAQSFLINEPSSKQSSTREDYQIVLPPMLTLPVNPTSVPLPCRISAQFPNDFTSAGYVNVAVLPANRSPNQFTPLDRGQWEPAAYHWRVARVPLVDTP